MEKLDPEHDDIDAFYQRARLLRHDIRSDDASVRAEAAERMRTIPGWRSLDDDEIISTDIPLKLAKMVIALEHDFPTWGEMRIFVAGKEMQRMKDTNLDEETDNE